MEIIPPVLHHHHHHPQHHTRFFSLSLSSLPMPRNPFYHSCSLYPRRAAAAAANANANANFRPFLLSLTNPYPPSSSSSSTHRPFFSFRFCFTTTTRSFCAAATSTPTTTTSISSPNSATTIPHHHVEQEEPSIPPQNTTPPALQLLLKTTTTTTTKKQRGAPLMTKESVAQMKQNWLSSLNNPSHPPNNIHVPNHDAWVIGIDPDVSGALALLKSPLHPHDPPGVSAQVFDSPHLKVLIGNRIRRRLDTKAISELLQSFDAPNGTIAYLEQSLPYPGDGKQGWWSGGFNYGIWIGVLVALGFSVVPVPSLLWKNQFKLSGNGSSKDASREAARTLFPSISSQLTRKKDHGYGGTEKMVKSLNSNFELSGSVEATNVELMLYSLLLMVKA